MSYELAHFLVLILVVVIGYLCMKLNSLKSASRIAVFRLLEDMQMLRHGIMANFSDDRWQHQSIEERRLSAIEGVDQLMGELKLKGVNDLVLSSLKSFQEPENWAVARRLARGPWAKDEEETIQ